VGNFVNETISLLETPRMPWHDACPSVTLSFNGEADVRGQVHMTIDGPVVLDIVQHFVERWNEVKQRKVSD
jgi:phospholipase D1/2